MTITNGVDADRLRAFIGRIERLEEEKAALAADIRDVYAELKGAGYCPKTTRQVIKLRKIEADDRREQEELLDLYKNALGMLADLPLGEAAIEREASPVRKSVRKMQGAKSATPHDPETGEVLCDAPAPHAVEILSPVAEDHWTDDDRVGPVETSSIGAVPYADGSLTGAVPAAQPYRVTDPAREPVAPAPDVSPLIADAAARMEAAKRLLGQGSAAE